jgi:hypothetical protein
VHRERHRLALRGRAASELVGDEPARRASLSFPQLSEEPRGNPAFRPARDEEVEGVAVLTHGASAVDALARDRDEPSSRSQVSPRRPARFSNALAYAGPNFARHCRMVLVGDDGYPLRQQVLDVTKAQA